MSQDGRPDEDGEQDRDDENQTTNEVPNGHENGVAETNNEGEVNTSEKMEIEKSEQDGTDNKDDDNDNGNGNDVKNIEMNEAEKEKENEKEDDEAKDNEDENLNEDDKKEGDDDKNEDDKNEGDNDDDDTKANSEGDNDEEGKEKDKENDNDDDDDDDPFAGLDDVATLDLHSISNYTFGKKDTKSKSKAMSDMSPRAISNALRKDYERRGLRRSVRAVILVHEHNFAHVLLLQRSDGKGEYVLPGGRLRAGENFEQGLLRKLSAKLCTEDGAAVAEGNEEDEDALGENPTLEVGDKLGKWYAIDFSGRCFPYIPAHVTKVKEEIHLFTVSLPSKFVFAVPKNLQLVAVPLCDVHNNAAVYGSMIGAVPALVSRFDINFC